MKGIQAFISNRNRAKINKKIKSMNKSIALLALLAASATAKCDRDYECTLYDLEYLDNSNGSYP